MTHPRARRSAALPPLVLLLLILLTAAADDPFASAPRCPSWPRLSMSERDKEGRLWGFAQGASCAFKTPQGAPQQLDAFDASYACGDTPTPYSSTRDSLGRLWGWDEERRRSCAYKEQKEGSSRPRLYETYEPGDWLSTVACPGASAGAATIYDPSAVTDTNLKTWSWGGFSDSPRRCAYKDDRQAPLPPRPSDYNRLSFQEAPACGGSDSQPGAEAPSPANARPDRDGLLWGWWSARPCAWKRAVRDPASGRLVAVTPIYYQGFRGVRTTASAPTTTNASPPAQVQPGGGSANGEDAPPINAAFHYARREGANGPLPSLGTAPP